MLSYDVDFNESNNLILDTTVLPISDYYNITLDATTDIRIQIEPIYPYLIDYRFDNVSGISGNLAVNAYNSIQDSAHFLTYIFLNEDTYYTMSIPFINNIIHNRVEYCTDIYKYTINAFNLRIGRVFNYQQSMVHDWVLSEYKYDPITGNGYDFDYISVPDANSGGYQSSLDVTNYPYIYNRYRNTEKYKRIPIYILITNVNYKDDTEITFGNTKMTPFEYRPDKWVEPVISNLIGCVTEWGDFPNLQFECIDTTTDTTTLVGVKITLSAVDGYYTPAITENELNSIEYLNYILKSFYLYDYIRTTLKNFDIVNIKIKMLNQLQFVETPNIPAYTTSKGITNPYDYNLITLLNSGNKNTPDNVRTLIFNYLQWNYTLKLDTLIHLKNISTLQTMDTGIFFRYITGIVYDQRLKHMSVTDIYLNNNKFNIAYDADGLLRRNYIGTSNNYFTNGTNERFYYNIGLNDQTTEDNILSLIIPLYNYTAFEVYNQSLYVGILKNSNVLSCGQYAAYNDNSQLISEGEDPTEPYKYIFDIIAHCPHGRTNDTLNIIQTDHTNTQTLLITSVYNIKHLLLNTLYTLDVTNAFNYIDNNIKVNSLYTNISDTTSIFYISISNIDGNLYLLKYLEEDLINMIIDNITLSVSVFSNVQKKIFQKIIKLQNIMNKYINNDSIVYMFLINENILSIDLLMNKNYINTITESPDNYYIPSDVVIISSNKM